ncbi:hypothetical protein FRC17_001581, partial [Serendipita sp. 399]
MASWRLCDTAATLDLALSALIKADVIFLDCEGKDLGEVGGRLSLISLGAVREIPSSGGQTHLDVFLIDAIALATNNNDDGRSGGGGLLEPIYELLRRETVLKVGYDLRMDVAEFWHGHGVKIENVLDLQVADILARQ